MSSSPSDPEIPPTVDPNSCALLGPPALLVQACMLIFVLASLLVKRQFFEKSRRTWKVWLFDVSKQLIGQALVHASNLLISDQVAHHGNSNPCSTYFLNVLVDTTIGVLCIYVSLKGLTYLCVSVMKWPGCISGRYGNPPRINYLVRQTAIYLTSLLFMKLFVIILFLFTLPSVLLPFANWILGWMSEWTQVVFVMAAFPLLMNVLQFCLIDQLIKASSADMTGSKDPLLPKHTEDADSDANDEDDDDDEHYHGHHERLTPTSPIFSLGRQSHDEESDKQDCLTIERRSPMRTKISQNRSGTSLPSSPLLEPVKAKEYGSTDVSPSPSPKSWHMEEHESSSKETTSSSTNKAVAQEVARILSPSEIGESEPVSALSHFSDGSGHSRRLSDDMCRQARRSLSSDMDAGQKVTRGTRDRWEDGVGMKKRTSEG